MSIDTQTLLVYIELEPDLVSKSLLFLLCLLPDVMKVPNNTEYGWRWTQERLHGAGRIGVEFRLSRWRGGNLARKDTNNCMIARIQNCRFHPEDQMSEAEKAPGWCYTSGIPLGVFPETSEAYLVYLLGSSHWHVGVCWYSHWKQEKITCSLYSNPTEPPMSAVLFWASLPSPTCPGFPVERTSSSLTTYWCRRTAYEMERAACCNVTRNYKYDLG